VFTDDEVKGQQNRKWGIKPKPAPEAFTGLEEDVRRSIRPIQRARLYPKGSVRGLVYEPAYGRLRNVY
jgi:carbonic anhydrase